MPDRTAPPGSPPGIEEVEVNSYGLPGGALVIAVNRSDKNVCRIVIENLHTSDWPAAHPMQIRVEFGERKCCLLETERNDDNHH